MQQNNLARPKKTPLPASEQTTLRDKAIKKIKELFLPDKKILKIILIGSSVKNDFGKYEPPGFRGSLYSDFDFIFFVKDDYEIPDWLNKEPDGKPFADEKLNLAYRNAKIIDNNYDIEFFFIRENNITDKIIEEGENAGIPMKKDSKIEHLKIF